MKKNNDNNGKDSKIVYTPKNTNNNENGKKKVSKNFKDIYSSSKASDENESSNTKKTIFKLLLIFLIVAVVFVVGIILSFLLKFQSENLDVNNLGIDESQVFSEDITNFALLGVDKNGTSDAIMIVSLDGSSKKIKLISVLRDSLVVVYPKNKKPYKTKITEAYGDGGAETTIRTINKNFGLNISRFASIDFSGMATIIEKLGGLNLSITKAERDEVNGIINTTPELKKRRPKTLTEYGENIHLDGTQAVAFARIRKDQTVTGERDDFGRTLRHRIVLEKIFEAIKQIDYSKIPGLVNATLPLLKTSLSFDEIINLYKIAKNKEYVVEKTAIPDHRYLINLDYRLPNGKSTVYYDLNYAKDLLTKYIYEDVAPDKYIESNPPKKTSSSQNEGSFKEKYNLKDKPGQKNQKSSNDKFSDESDKAKKSNKTQTKKNSGNNNEKNKNNEKKKGDENKIIEKIKGNEKSKNNESKSNEKNKNKSEGSAVKNDENSTGNKSKTQTNLNNKSNSSNDTNQNKNEKNKPKPKNN